MTVAAPTTGQTPSAVRRVNRKEHAAQTQTGSGIGPSGDRRHPRRWRRCLEGETNPRKELVTRCRQRQRGTRTRRWRNTLKPAGAWTERHVTEAEGTTRSMLDPGGTASGRRATNGRERGSGSDVRPGVPGRTRWGRRTRSVRAERRRDPSRPPDHREVTTESVKPNRATGESTRSRRTSRTRAGQPARGRTDGATKPQPHRRKADGRRLRVLAAASETTGSAAMDRAARASTSSSDEVGTNGRRGAGRSDAVRLPTRSKPSQGGAPAGTTDPAREASASTTDPPKTWRTQTRYRLQHAGARERRKPSRW